MELLGHSESYLFKKKNDPSTWCFLPAQPFEFACIGRQESNLLFPIPPAHGMSCLNQRHQYKRLHLEETAQYDF
jgi:hypothetical protein